MVEHPRVDPEIVAAVEGIRDRFGVHGLRDAAALLDVEIARVTAETAAAFATLDAEPEVPDRSTS